MPVPPKSKLKQEISKAFKLHGYTLKVEASRHLEELLTPLANNVSNHWIETILDTLSKKDLQSSVLDKQILDKIIKEVSNEVAGDVSENVLNVIDVFSIPTFTYSVDRKKFFPQTSEKKILADADSKANLFLSRYLMLLQKTQRLNIFLDKPASRSSSTSLAFADNSANLSESQGEENEKKYSLKSVDFLLGTNSRLENVIVLGMLAMLKHGRYSIEDPTGSLDLDMSETKFSRGLYTENNFVLAQGWYEDQVFHVAALGHPSIESSQATRNIFGSINFFGGPLEITPKADQRLKAIEEQNDGAMFVFISDLWLDRPEVISRIKKLLLGYSAMPPTAFVFMGNFMASTSENGPAKTKLFKDLFKSLGDVIIEHKELLQKSKFIFVPGPNDPGFANIYPRPPFPQYLTQDLVSRIEPQFPNAVIMASNPCRIQFCTQEIVIFREDIMSKMCRNCVYFPEQGEVSTHFAKTILSQGHLTPLPLHNCPVHWDFDQSMWLYPLPDLVVIGDKLDHFTSEKFEGCQVVNPGSFGKNDFTFKTYVPKLKLVEDSQVPEDQTS